MAIRKCRECGGQVSTKADVCPHCGYNIKRATDHKAGCLGTVILIVAGLVLLGKCSDDNGSGGSSAESTPSSDASALPSKAPEKRPSKPAPAVALKILKVDRYDAPVKTQISCHALVSGELTKEGLENTLNALYEKANNTGGWQYGTGPSHVFIYLYTSEAHYRSGAGQWIAMLQKVGDDDEKHITIRDNLLKQLDAVPAMRFGLAEAQRREVFELACLAEDKADVKAKREMPVGVPRTAKERQTYAERLGEQIDLMRKLCKEYEGQICQKYAITTDQLQKIKAEAMTKNWPLPPSKSVK